MRCLCHVLAHAAYALDWPVKLFDDFDSELQAFAACSANAGDVAYLKDSPYGSKALLLAALYRQPLHSHRLVRAPQLYADADIQPFDIDAFSAFMRDIERSPIDLLVAKRNLARPSQAISLHQISLELPRSFLYVQGAEGLLIPSPSMHLLLRARQLDPLILALVISEYCGTYRMRPDLQSGHISKARRLASRERLMQFADTLAPGTHCRRRFKAAIELAFDNSASPRETALAVLLALPRRKGGAGLPRPQLNCPISLSPEAARLAGRDTIKPDFFWPEQRVCLEYQGAGYHSGLTKAQADNNRAAALEQDGYRCVQVTNEQVNTPEQFALLAGRIAALLGIKMPPLDARDLLFCATHQAIMGARCPW